jgi:hypothetical protein
MTTKKSQLPKITLSESVPPPSKPKKEARKEITEEEKAKRKEYYNMKRKEKVHIEYLKKRLPIEEAKVARYKQEIANYEKTDAEFLADESLPDTEESPSEEKPAEPADDIEQQSEIKEMKKESKIRIVKQIDFGN